MGVHKYFLTEKLEGSPLPVVQVFPYGKTWVGRASRKTTPSPSPHGNFAENTSALML